MSGELQGPEQGSAPARVVEGQIVSERERELSRSGSLLERLVLRAGLAAVLGVIALALVAAGALLTATIVGAAVGVPLALLGLALGAAAVWILVGGGTMVFRFETTGKRKGGSGNENGD